MALWEESSFSCSFQIENDDYYRFRRVECHVYRDASAVMLVDSFDGHIPWSTLKFLLQEVACVAPQAVILLVLVVDKVRVCLL